VLQWSFAMYGCLALGADCGFRIVVAQAMEIGPDIWPMQKLDTNLHIV